MECKLIKITQRSSVAASDHIRKDLHKRW